MLVVSHDHQGDSHAGGSNVVMLDEIISERTDDQVMEDPQHPYTANLYIRYYKENIANFNHKWKHRTRA